MTTSTEAARILRDHLEHALLDELGATVVAKVEVLEPASVNQDWAHAALVVHLTTGERFGLEVCPFPSIPAMPTGTVRSVTTEPRPCAKPECGLPLVDHAGWALGHLYAEPYEPFLGPDKETN